MAAGGFDLILMDMQMPVMDGYTAVRTLRSRGVATPIIALSAHAMKGYEQEVLAAGCTGYVTKPIDIDVLLERLAQLLGGERLAVQPQDDALSGVGASSPVPLGVDSAPRSLQAASDQPIHSRFADQPRLSPIVAKFAARLRERIDEAWAYHADGDFEELGRFGHWLAGSAGMMGYDSLTGRTRTGSAGEGRGQCQLIHAVGAAGWHVQPARGSAAGRGVVI